MSPALFSISSLRWGLITQLCFWCGQAALFLVLALYLQDGRGLDPLKSGLVFTILAVAYLATSLPAPRWTVRFGREVIAVGAIMLAVGEASLAGVVALNGSRGALGALVPGLLLAGAGMGLCITPLTTVILAHCDPERAGAVSGAMSTMQQVGNAVGVAITGLVYFGSLHSGTAKAFEVSAVQLAGLLAAVAVLTRWLPAQPRSV
jgi:MFS family permease